METKQKNAMIDAFMYESVNLEKSKNISNLEYNCNWKWLMPVVRRIMIDEKFWQEDSKPYLQRIKDVTPYADIDDVYKAVFSFILWWYSKQN